MKDTLQYILSELELTTGVSYRIESEKFDVDGHPHIRIIMWRDDEAIYTDTFIGIQDLAVVEDYAFKKVLLTFIGLGISAHIKHTT